MKSALAWICLISLTPLSMVSANDSRELSVAARFQWSASHGERTGGGIYRDSVAPSFFGTNEDFAWYRVGTGKDSSEFVLIDTKTGTRSLAFDHAKLASQLQEATGEPVNPIDLPFRTIEFSEDVGLVTFSFGKKAWVWNRSENSLQPASADGIAADTLGGMQPLASVRNSGNGEPTDIEIRNDTDGVLEVFWVDSQWGRRSYGRIGAGESFSSSTYVNHAWVIVDDQGKDRAAFQAGAGANVGYVTEQTPPPRPRERSAGGRSGRFGDRSSNTDRNSPNDVWTVFFRDNNVVLMHRDTREEIQLTDDGSEGNAYGGRVYWAPNSEHLIVFRTEVGDNRMVTMIDSAPDNQTQPLTKSINYTKPGDKLDHPRPYLFHMPASPEALKGDVNMATLGGKVSDDLFPNPYQMNEYAWLADSSEFTFVYNQRGHEVLRVIAIDAATGAARAVVDETSETFVCYSQKFFYQRFEDTDEVLWMTERDGWNHLVLYDWKTGEVKNRVTQGEWVVREVERVDPQSRTLWLKVSGVNAGEDPYHVHFARVGFDGTGLTLLTAGDGNHSWEFSPEGRWIIDRYSRVDLPTVTTLRNAETGAMVCELERGDWSELLASGWIPPERFVAKGRDGTTDIHGIIIRPTNFDSSLKYPILEAIYAGPHSSFTPKSFGRQRGLYEMADMGFIVVKMDGMGTSDRSKAFHDVCWKNLGDSGFPDRILWMKAAAEQHPEMDIKRVGIWGGSAGGQSALRALLGFGDFYDAAAADCGCHDNRMDKIWWNEQWMGWPIGPHYEEQSNVTQAHRLQGKLLLTVGELDTNVDPASTMQVVDALINADKDFEMIVFPGAGHGIGSGAYGTRRMKDFFVRSLGGPEIVNPGTE